MGHCALGVKCSQRRSLLYAQFALLLIRPEIQYQAEPRTQFSLIIREGIPVAEIISE